MTTRVIRLVRDVLDHDVFDVDGTPCGVVDDVELEARDDGGLVVTALLIGPGAWVRRLPGALGGVAARMFGRSTRRVPWSHVARIDARVILDEAAHTLGLDAHERRAARWIERIPGS